MARPYTKKEREEKKKLFLEALEESMGMITSSCERAGLTRDTVIAWRKSDPDFDERINVIKEKQREYVEGQLMSLIRQGTPSAIYFWLKCQAGWHETQRIEVENTNDIDVKAAIEEIRKSMEEK